MGEENNQYGRQAKRARLNTSSANDRGELSGVGVNTSRLSGVDTDASRWRDIGEDMRVRAMVLAGYPYPPSSFPEFLEMLRTMQLFDLPQASGGQAGSWSSHQRLPGSQASSSVPCNLREPSLAGLQSLMPSPYQIPYRPAPHATVPHMYHHPMTVMPSLAGLYGPPSCTLHHHHTNVFEDIPPPNPFSYLNPWLPPHTGLSSWDSSLSGGGLSSTAPSSLRLPPMYPGYESSHVGFGADPFRSWYHLPLTNPPDTFDRSGCDATSRVANAMNCSTESGPTSQPRKKKAARVCDTPKNAKAKVLGKQAPARPPSEPNTTATPSAFTRCNSDDHLTRRHPSNAHRARGKALSGTTKSPSAPMGSPSAPMGSPSAPMVSPSAPMASQSGHMNLHSWSLDLPRVLPSGSMHLNSGPMNLNSAPMNLNSGSVNCRPMHLLSGSMNLPSCGSMNLYSGPMELPSRPTNLLGRPQKSPMNSLGGSMDSPCETMDSFGSSLNSPSGGVTPASGRVTSISGLPDSHIVPAQSPAEQIDSPVDPVNLDNEPLYSTSRDGSYTDTARCFPWSGGGESQLSRGIAQYGGVMESPFSDTPRSQLSQNSPPQYRITDSKDTTFTSVAGDSTGARFAAREKPHESEMLGVFNDILKSTTQHYEQQ